jgi:hypothetical protein
MGAPWMERESHWYAYSQESVWRDDSPAYEALRRAERAGDGQKIERAEARLRKLAETRAARVAAEARGRYQRDAEAGANGASLEALGAYDDGAPKTRGTRAKVSAMLGEGGR